MKTSIFLSTLVAFVGLTAISVTATAADACKNVKFNVTNDHFEGREIEIRKVKFRNPHNNGKQQTEDVKNKVCNHGFTCTTNGDNLKNSNKVDLYDFQVVFRYREHDGGWSNEFITQPFTPKYRKCKKDKKYGPIVVQDSP